MHTALTALPFLGLIALLSVAVFGLRAGRESTGEVRRLARAASFIMLAASLAAAAAVAIAGSASLSAFGLGIRLDALSVVMAVLVSFVGLIVVCYSVRYLDGDERQCAKHGESPSLLKMHLGRLNVIRLPHCPQCGNGAEAISTLSGGLWRAMSHPWRAKQQRRKP